LARARCLAHVALDQPAVGAADVGNRLPGRKVHDRIDVHAGVRLPPTEHWYVDHGRCQGVGIGDWFRLYSLFRTIPYSELFPIQNYSLLPTPYSLAQSLI